MRQDKDRATKWLIANHGDSILRLAGIEGFVRWKAVVPETVAPRRLPDGLLEVRFPEQADPTLVLVEVETYPASDADPQTFEDILIVRMEKRRLPEVVCFVLKSRGNVAVNGHVSETSAGGTTRLAADWRVVRLWELDADDLLANGDIGLVPFAPLARSTRTPLEVLTACRDRIDQVPDMRDRATLLAVASVYSDLAFPEQRSFDFYGGYTKMTESPVWEEMRRAMAEHYHVQWKEEGLVEGRAEGRRIVLREDTLADLAERFGSVPADVTDRVNASTDEPRLRALRKLALTAPTFDAFLVELLADAR